MQPVYCSQYFCGKREDVQVDSDIQMENAKDAETVKGCRWLTETFILPAMCKNSWHLAKQTFSTTSFTTSPQYRRLHAVRWIESVCFAVSKAHNDPCWTL